LKDQAISTTLRLMSRLPEVATLRLRRPMGRLLHHIWPRRARVAEHLSFAFGGEVDLDGVLAYEAAFYEHLFQLFCEMGRLGHWSRERVLAAVDGSGQEHLSAALAQGRGAILITGHLGNWELAGAALSHHGYPLSVVASTQQNSSLQDYLMAIRRRHGLKVIPRHAPRECFTCLRENGVLVLLIDLRDPQGDIVVPFFDRPTTCLSGPAVLAMKTGAPVLLGAVWRKPDGRFEGEVSPALPVVKSGDRDRDVLENTALFHSTLEKAIRRYPAQWIWDYRRWRVMSRGRGRRREASPERGTRSKL
jgi:Kdo2-lipid IVA lauroyltransferase/acyltransferase